MPRFKPMLARDAKLDKLTFPLIAQPKLDGIRCSIVGGRAVARSLKPIPNEEIRAYLEREEFNGLDGELIVGDPRAEDAYNRSVSFVMSRSKRGEDWSFYVFDHWSEWDQPTDIRLAHLTNLVETNFGCNPLTGDYLSKIACVKSQDIEAMEELEEYEQKALDHGFEGIILRDPLASYKFGRSGVRGPLLKLKRFVDGEAEIIGVEEEMHNANEARTNELGRTERSTSKAGLRGKGTLGALVVRDLETGVEFKIGTGFNAAQRADFWHIHTFHGEGAYVDGATAASAPRLIGEVVKYKSFPVGVKDRPRFPVFLGFRDLSIDG